MKWIDAYSTGIERLDGQHKLLFKMSEDFREAIDEGHGERVYGELLRSLDTYARGHFGQEEQCMEQYRCPVAQANKRAHAEFIEVLTDFKSRHAASGYDSADAHALVDMIDDWLSGHICTIDVQLKGSVEDA